MILNFSKKIALGIMIATAVTAGLSAMEYSNTPVPQKKTNFFTRMISSEFETADIEERIIAHTGLQMGMLATGAATAYAVAGAMKGQTNPWLAGGALGVQFAAMCFVRDYAARSKEQARANLLEVLVYPSPLNDLPDRSLLKRLSYSRACDRDVYRRELYQEWDVALRTDGIALVVRALTVLEFLALVYSVKS